MRPHKMAASAAATAAGASLGLAAKTASASSASAAARSRARANRRVRGAAVFRRAAPPRARVGASPVSFREIREGARVASECDGMVGFSREDGFESEERDVWFLEGGGGDAGAREGLDVGRAALDGGVGVVEGASMATEF